MSKERSTNTHVWYERACWSLVHCSSQRLAFHDGRETGMEVKCRWPQLKPGCAPEHTLTGSEVNLEYTCVGILAHYCSAVNVSGACWVYRAQVWLYDSAVFRLGWPVPLARAETERVGGQLWGGGATRRREINCNGAKAQIKTTHSTVEIVILHQIDELRRAEHAVAVLIILCNILRRLHAHRAPLQAL